MRLIDADAIKYTARFTTYDDGKMTSDAIITKDEVDKLPTIDAVPVVRCEDCRFSFINENVDFKPLICGKTKMCGETKPDWFCAGGKRREE